MNFELDDLDRALILKVRAAVADENLLDAGDVVDVLHLLLEILDACPCGGHMEKGKALVSLFRGTPEWEGDTLMTMSPSGNAELVDCLKCVSCGHSRQLPHTPSASS